jgi:hypothetical protein
MLEGVPSIGYWREFTMLITEGMPGSTNECSRAKVWGFGDNAAFLAGTCNDKTEGQTEPHIQRFRHRDPRPTVSMTASPVRTERSRSSSCTFRRGHADAEEVVGRQLRQHFAIDIVVAECGRVLFEPQPA